MRNEIFEVLRSHGGDHCRKCGEQVFSDQHFRIEGLIDPYGMTIGYVCQHIDCANPTLNTIDVTGQKNTTPAGKHDYLCRELMKDGPALTDMPETEKVRLEQEKFIEKHTKKPD